MVIFNIQHFLFIYVLAKFVVVCFLLMCLFIYLAHIIWQLHICIYGFHHVILSFYCAHKPHHALDEGKPPLHIAALFFLWTCLLQSQQLISNNQWRKWHIPFSHHKPLVPQWLWNLLISLPMHDAIVVVLGLDWSGEVNTVRWAHWWRGYVTMSRPVDSSRKLYLFLLFISLLPWCSLHIGGGDMMSI